MQNTDIIRSGVAYIEQNLKTDITPEEWRKWQDILSGIISIYLHR